MNTKFSILTNLIAFSLLFITIESTSQTNTFLASANTSGHIAIGNSGSASYSVGQVFFTHQNTEDINLEQGVQRANLSQAITAPEDADIAPEDSIKEVLVYPNPTTNFITLTAKGFTVENKVDSFQLYNYQGQLIMQDAVSAINTKINLGSLSSSVYVLHVFVKDKLFKSFKLLKK